eukprot:31138-Pelagococcus_subviridis.AAC.3
MRRDALCTSCSRARADSRPARRAVSSLTSSRGLNPLSRSRSRAQRGGVGVGFGFRWPLAVALAHALALAVALAHAVAAFVLAPEERATVEPEIGVVVRGRVERLRERVGVAQDGRALRGRGRDERGEREEEERERARDRKPGERRHREYRGMGRVERSGESAIRAIQYGVGA